MPSRSCRSIGFRLGRETDAHCRGFNDENEARRRAFLAYPSTLPRLESSARKSRFQAVSTLVDRRKNKSHKENSKP